MCTSNAVTELANNVRQACVQPHDESALPKMISGYANPAYMQGSVGIKEVTVMLV